MPSDTTADRTDPIPTVVPEDAVAATCPYCDRPFPSDRLRSLHLGERHGERLTDGQRSAYEDAEDQEVDDLFVYHLKVVSLIVVVVMGLSYVYAFALA
jgi:hypothetical protein